MASAVSIARYLLDEASSGTAPSTCADDEGGHDLTIDYGTSHANWSSNADGNGLDFLSTSGAAVAEIADMSAAGSIGGQLDGLKEASLIFVARIDNGHANSNRVVFLGSSSGNGELAITAGTADLELRFGEENSGGDTKFNVTHDGSEHIYHCVWDSALAGAATTRAKLWIDGVEQTAAVGTIPQNHTLITQAAGISFCLGNRPSANRQIDAALWYCELFTGKLSASEISDSYDALLLDHDSNWAGAPPAPADVDALMMTGGL